ncbi:carbohydrate ABC transporter permease [Frondihabitans cladoniiphilus]|uniref:Sugar ABC transporter permease n=1 Tax=Frondihabitans cladoniiphilus TaxID=715785 RepID=A0ABP8VWN7_9MICO
MTASSTVAGTPEVPAPRKAEGGGKPGSVKGRKRGPSILGRHPLGLLFSAPYLIFVLLIFAYPLIYAVYIAFHDYFFAAPGATVSRPFVGLQNFTDAFTDPDVIRSFGNVGIFLIINVPLTVVFSMVLAAGLNKVSHFRGFLRVAYYVPYLTASVAVVAVWLFLFSGPGLVNQILGPLAPNPSWLINSGWAMPSIALFVTWKQMGFYILLYLAALQNVPNELYEAASTDGAGAIRRFFSVTVPGVRPATVLVLLVSTVTGANLFTEPYLLTNGGGPNGASASPVLLMYQKGIEQGHPDEASAIGIVLVILVLIIAFFQNRFAGGRD